MAIKSRFPILSSIVPRGIKRALGVPVPPQPNADGQAIHDDVDKDNLPGRSLNFRPPQRKPAPPTPEHRSQLRNGSQVESRLIGHIFSVDGENMEGSYVADTFHEMHLQLTQFTAANSSAFADEMRPLVAPMQQASVWARRMHRASATEKEAIAAEMAHAISQQDHTLMPGTFFGIGTNGKMSGHAVVYETRKQDDGDVTFRVYNTGLGLHHHHKKTDSSKHYQTYYEVRDIDPASLGAKDIALLFGKGASDRSVGRVCNDIYHFITWLGVTSPPSGRYQKAQEVGNCAWKSLTAVVKNQTSQRGYLTFKEFFQANTLRDFAKDKRPKRGHVPQSYRRMGAFNNATNTNDGQSINRSDTMLLQLGQGRLQRTQDRGLAHDTHLREVAAHKEHIERRQRQAASDAEMARQMEEADQHEAAQRARRMADDAELASRLQRAESSPPSVPPPHEQVVMQQQSAARARIVNGLAREQTIDPIAAAIARAAAGE